MIADLVAFDLDDTLAPSKSTVPARMLDLLAELTSLVDVAVISGARLEQFTGQLIDPLRARSQHAVSRVHLLPTCGARYVRLQGGELEPVYSRELDSSTRSRVARVLEAEARRLGLWEAEPWGEVIEDRGAQITFSALGQHAPLALKEEWDPSGDKRKALCAAVGARLDGLEVRAGGSTSVDITEQGIDKAFGMRELSRHTAIPPERMLFFGDRLDEGGNDYPVRMVGVPCRQVSSWEDTATQVAQLVEAMRARD